MASASALIVTYLEVFIDNRLCFNTSKWQWADCLTEFVLQEEERLKKKYLLAKHETMKAKHNTMFWKASS